jgi:hypothetical protein
MKRILLTLLCTAALFGQEVVSRVVQLKYVHPDNTQAVLDILAAGKVRWRTDTSLKIIAMNGPNELVEAMEAAIKKLDVPPPAIRNIELTFNILVAGSQAGADTVPPDLTGVVQQLGKVFGLKSFRLLETAVLRGREGRPMESGGILAIPVKVESSPRYFLRFQRVSTSPAEKGLLIRIDGLEFNVSIPVLKVGGQGLDYMNPGMKTDIDVREGQKIVVGKSSLDTTGQSVFLVVSAKVLD